MQVEFLDVVHHRSPVLIYHQMSCPYYRFLDRVIDKVDGSSRILCHSNDTTMLSFCSKTLEEFMRWVFDVHAKGAKFNVIIDVGNFFCGRFDGRKQLSGFAI